MFCSVDVMARSMRHVVHLKLTQRLLKLITFNPVINNRLAIKCMLQRVVNVQLVENVVTLFTSNLLKIKIFQIFIYKNQQKWFAVVHLNVEKRKLGSRKNGGLSFSLCVYELIGSREVPRPSGEFVFSTFFNHF